MASAGQPPESGGLDSIGDWLAAGCPDLGADRMSAIITTLIDDVHSLRLPDSGFDERLESAVPHIPESLVLPLLRELQWREGLPLLRDALGRRVVELAPDVEALGELLDSRSLRVEHQLLAVEALMARGRPGALVVVERAPGLETKVLVAALARATDAYELVVAPSGRALVDECWYDAVLDLPIVLRDRRWFGLAPHLSDGGVGLYIAIAQDPLNDMSDHAIARLVKRLNRARDPREKKHALSAVAATGHYAATPALLAILWSDFQGVCNALASCGDERALPVLEARLDGGYQDAFVRFAITNIRARIKEIHPSLARAACRDADPAIADLARRASAGDEDAAAVLADALRERHALIR